MGPLTPGLPPPSMLPRVWQMVVINLKDCFLTFCCTLKMPPNLSFRSCPWINRCLYRDTIGRFFPRANHSLMICPWFGAHILSSIRQQFPNMIILHYMDAILIYGKISTILNLVLASVSKAVQDTGFEVAVSKIQCTSPWKHLGLRILERIIISQPLDIRTIPGHCENSIHFAGASIGFILCWESQQKTSCHCSSF